MKTIKRLFLLTIAISGGMSTTLAGDHPQANFGIYGIQHQPTIERYQQYVGQIVKYLPGDQGSGNYIDKEYFIKVGGSFDKEYTITKVSGNDKRMTFLLQEKDGKTKVKLVVNNQDEYYSYGKYAYCITNEYSIPLFLIEKYNTDKSKFQGKVYPEQASPIKMEVSDLVLQESKDKIKDYPKVMLILKDKESGKTYNADPDINFSIIGKEFTNPHFKCKYNVISVVTKKNEYYPYRVGKYYTLKNSLDGTTKDVPVGSALYSAFSGDDAGHFVATLTKVEKPLNSTIRYGNTTTVTDKDITKFSYVDNFIDILIFASKTQFNFVLKNVSDNTIKIVWNEAVFVDVDGGTSKVMHSGIKYSQREGDQPASTIIKSAKLEDVATPTDKVYYDDLLKEWTSKSLYEKAKIKEKLKRQTIKLMLPIQVKDVVNEYIFEFELKYVYIHPEYVADGDIVLPF